uniref:uncharacterized protein LOC113474931 n=1 Tax=Ciona intestinalis TaxID=7719 RepID=UPI000EF4DFAB|nr:uncharacterized protein LOC113474931 [Ciona intestinalis]|eukprot:XP_026693803.1 uncharacterized protein LOC113474931 [Ciona intestinalis]
MEMLQLFAKLVILCLCLLAQGKCEEDSDSLMFSASATKFFTLDVNLDISGHYCFDEPVVLRKLEAYSKGDTNVVFDVFATCITNCSFKIIISRKDGAVGWSQTENFVDWGIQADVDDCQGITCPSGLHCIDFDFGYRCKCTTNMSAPECKG